MPLDALFLTALRGELSAQLAGCRVIKDSATNFVGEAVLMLKPNALLTWEGGQLPLDDLFTKPTQPKQRNET